MHVDAAKLPLTHYTMMHVDAAMLKTAIDDSNVLYLEDKWDVMYHLKAHL